MYDYLPDPIERGEMRMEDWAFENIKGDLTRCVGCERWLPSNGCWETLSPDPYSIPICGDCFEKECEKWTKERET